VKVVFPHAKPPSTIKQLGLPTPKKPQQFCQTHHLRNLVQQISANHNVEIRLLVQETSSKQNYPNELQKQRPKTHFSNPDMIEILNQFPANTDHQLASRELRVQ
jgi:hypothetical protein